MEQSQVENKDGKRHVKFVVTGDSIDSVARQAARSFTKGFLCSNIKFLSDGILDITGEPLDFVSQEAPVEARIFIRAFSEGVAACLGAVISGNLDICLLKLEIGSQENPDNNT